QDILHLGVGEIAPDLPGAQGSGIAPATAPAPVHRRCGATRRAPPGLGAACAALWSAAGTRRVMWHWPGFSAHTDTTGPAAPGRSVGLRVGVLPPPPAVLAGRVLKIAATARRPAGPDRCPRRWSGAPGGWRVRGAAQTLWRSPVARTELPHPRRQYQYPARACWWRCTAPGSDVETGARPPGADAA